MTRWTSYTVADWVALFYLGFFGTVLGFVWYYQGIQRIGAMKAGVFINFVPISAIVFSFFILNEPLSLSLLFGAAIVLSGLYLPNPEGITAADRRRMLDGLGRLNEIGFERFRDPEITTRMGVGSNPLQGLLI